MLKGQPVLDDFVTFMGRPRTCAAIALFVALLAAPLAARAQPAAARRLPSRAGVIALRAADVDTHAEENLLQRRATFEHGRHYVVRLDGPMTPHRRQQLADAGVVLGDCLPGNAYWARLANVSPQAVQRLGFVPWVGRLQDSWKIDPAIGQRTYQTAARWNLAQAGYAQVTISLFTGEEAGPTIEAVARLGAAILNVDAAGRQWLIDAIVPTTDTGPIAALPAVEFIEDAPEGTFRNDTNRWILQSDLSAQTPVWDHGIHGENQIGGLIDGTPRESHCMFDDPNGTAPGPLHRKFVGWRNAGATDPHGTHTAGTFAGDNSPYGSYTTNDGLAYAAKLSFSCVDPIYTDPSTLYARLQDAHGDGARVHSNSWGDDGTTAYTTWCRQIDQFSYDYEDSLVAFAVTNLSALKTPENAKNVLAVAATQDTPNEGSKCIGGTGPTADGRRKPEVWAPGCATVSASSVTSCGTTTSTGTSMACPAVAGAGLLVRQYFTDGFYPTGAAVPADAFTPSGALVKAVLINASVDMTGLSGYPGNQEGWGRVLLDGALYFAGDTSQLCVVDVRNANGLSTSQTASYNFNVLNSTVPLRVTLVFTEPPAAVGASNPVINNLDLEVTDPNGLLYRGNVFSSGQSTTGGTADAQNNVEQVHRFTPATGAYTATIRGTAVNEGTQGYALVITGAVAPCTPPEISTSPASASRYVGESVTFTVVASGSEPLHYQWQRDANDITGATGDSFTIDAITLDDAGDYTCNVSNACGSAPSQAATLTVSSPCVEPSITTHPASQSRDVSQSVTFSVVATGTPTLHYQWQHDANDISSATGDSYTIDSVTPADAGDYKCVVSNDCGTVPSNSATLTVAPLLCAGDSNCDGIITWRDIDPFVAALNDNESAWTALFLPGVPACPFSTNDVNADGHVTWRDISPFVSLMNTTCP